MIEWGRGGGADEHFWKGVKFLIFITSLRSGFHGYQSVLGEHKRIYKISGGFEIRGLILNAD